jgi:hypothetical protein
MKECNNSKIHISSKFLLSTFLLIMLVTLLLGPSLHCNTLLHFTTLHPTTLHNIYRHFTSSHLHSTTLSFGLTYLHLYKLDESQYMFLSFPLSLSKFLDGLQLQVATACFLSTSPNINSPKLKPSLFPRLCTLTLSSNYVT